MTICKAVDFLPVVRDVVVGGDGLPPLDPTVAAAPRPLPLLLVALTAIAAVPQVHGAPGDGVGGPRLAPSARHPAVCVIPSVAMFCLVFFQSLTTNWAAQ